MTVIIPTHDRADILINTCLPSVLAQTHKPMLVLIVAHGCTDSTEEKVEQFVRNNNKLYPSVRVFIKSIPKKLHYPDTPENRWLCGPVDPINAALKECTNDHWIARIDDDDQWVPDHLESVLKYAKKKKLEFVSAMHTSKNKVVMPYKLDDGTLVGGTQTWVYRSYLRFFKWNRDCWRKHWNRVNDTDIQERMHRAGVRMGYLNKVTAIVDPRPGETEIGLKAYLQKE